ncbi:uncharacterized protein LOC122501098 [Leptopilina heterotoma]|uniref:uncharacterized protein LOC122501098 n=1 Tax=Leptopilina heterotoma TaxID=63436 RepID=UPI001CA8759E|nr:uncharacterized protein LOC122501098 [Leptopilina heterotoma]XP_043466300.1 uncharacterized protein LOC122501098 [Leptopilina heterotoma]XP_043466301.1 uncharacterized protein LOC122501098 [Leptopilina heterotoma]
MIGTKVKLLLKDCAWSCAMMGLQATSGKRKLEAGVVCMEFDMDVGENPSKFSRVDGSWWAMDENYSSHLSQTTTPSYYEMDSPLPCLQTGLCPSTSPTPPAQLHHSQHYYQRGLGNNGYNQLSRPTIQWAQPHNYEPPMIRREENGKSYLELGSSYRANERCCEGSRSSWCRRGRTCYRQRRLAVLNISMCKLARYRQFPDPSLHRSVLICNTLRHLEKEMERDRSPPPMEPVVSTPIAQLQSTEQGRLTPFPVPPISSTETDADSGIGDSEDSRSINWGSVLSLSSQSPLDPLNNNELLDVDIGPDLELDLIPGWKLTPLSADDILRNTNAQEHHVISNVSIGSTSSNYESLMCVGS